MNKKLLWLVVAAFILANILAGWRVFRSSPTIETTTEDQLVVNSPPVPDYFVTPEQQPPATTITPEAIAQIACPQPLIPADWPAKMTDRSIAPISWSNHQLSLADQRWVNQSYSDGINLAGHFHLASRSCGDDCQEAIIINTHNGEIIAPGAESELETVSGWQFSVTSILLIANPGSTNPQQPTVYYLVEDKGLRRICYLSL